MKWMTPGILAVLFGCASPPAASPTPQSAAETNDVQKRVREALARLDEKPDMLHFDYTPAVSELIDLGEPAIEPTLPYLLSDSWATRVHAETAVAGAIQRMHGFVRGQGWTSTAGEEAHRRLCPVLWGEAWAGHTSLADTPRPMRVAYIEQVKRWLASRRV